MTHLSAMDTAPAGATRHGRPDPHSGCGGCQQVECLCKTGPRNPIETRLKQPAAIL